MAAFAPRTATEIANAFVAKVVARSGLTDILPTDDLYAIAYAFATELSASEFQVWSFRQSFDLLNPDITLADFQLRVQELPADKDGNRFAIKGAISASGGILSLTRKDSSTEQILPKGTTFGRNDGSPVVYRTLVDLTFPIGFIGLDDIYVEATTPGVAGNCGIGTITSALSCPDWIISIGNMLPLTNGSDQESLQSAQRRVANYLSALAGSQKAALEYLAGSYISSTSTQALLAKAFYAPDKDHFAWLLVDDGSGFAGSTSGGPALTGTVPPGGQTIIRHPGPATAEIAYIQVTRYGSGLVENLTVANGQMFSLFEQGYIYVPANQDYSLQEGDVWALPSYSIYSGFIAELQQAVCGDVNDPWNFPGWMALGCRVVVCPPDTYTLTADIHVVPINGVNLGPLQNVVLNVVLGFLQSLGPGEPLYISNLVTSVMQQVPGILDIKFFVHNNLPGALPVPLQDIYPQDKQVVRSSINNLTFVTAV